MTPLSSLSDDLLCAVLSSVSQRTGGLWHALVCHQWATLASRSQTSVVSTPLAPKAVLNLTEILTYSSSSLRTLHLGLSGHGPVKGLAYLFSQKKEMNLPRLQVLKLSGAPHLPTSLEILLSAFSTVSPGLQSVTVTNLQGSAPISISSFSSLRNLSLTLAIPTIHRGLRTLSRLTALANVSRSLRKLTLGRCFAHECRVVQGFEHLTSLCLGLLGVKGGSEVELNSLAFLGSVTSLKKLRLRQELTTADIILPRGLSRLGSLRSLEMVNIGLAYFPPPSASFSSLHNLTIVSAQVSSLPSAVWQQASLRSLRLMIGHVDRLPEDLGNLRRLRKLVVRGSGPLHLPREMLKLEALAYLGLSESAAQALELEDLPQSVRRVQIFPNSPSGVMIRRMWIPLRTLEVSPEYSAVL